MGSVEGLHLGLVLSSVVYAVLGVVVLCLSFIIIDKLTPYDLWEQLVEHRNTALAIAMAGMFIAIGQIIAAAIHG